MYRGRGSAERSQLLRATSRLPFTCCEQHGWLHVLFPICGFGRDEVMMGPYKGFRCQGSGRAQAEEESL